MKKANPIQKLGRWIFDNKVMIFFALVCIGAIVVSKTPIPTVVDGVFTRVARNTFTVLALLIPVLAGMGLNFGIVIGAIATQIAMFFVVYWGFGGLEGTLLVLAIATPLAAFFGFLGGKLFNQMKGAEMIAGLILGYFADGLYQLWMLVIIGGVIPMKNPRLIIDGGIGVKNTIDLTGNLKYAIDDVSVMNLLQLFFFIMVAITLVKLIMAAAKRYKLRVSDWVWLGGAALFYGLTFIPSVKDFIGATRLPLLEGVTFTLAGYGIWQLYQIVSKKLIQKDQKFKLGKALLGLAMAGVLYGLTYLPEVERTLMLVRVPVLPYVLIAGLCLFNQKILDTRLGQNMRTVGQSQGVATASGINVDQIRVIAMIISTVLAAWGQMIYLQNIGTFSTYGAHTQIGQFAIAALLVGGASVQKATNRQAIIGVILFHTLFLVAPQAGKELFNNPQIGEYFRVFVSYGVIALSLAMHAWKRVEKKRAVGQAAPPGDPRRDDARKDAEPQAA